MPRGAAPTDVGPDLLKPTVESDRKPVTLVAFTPATSYQFGLQMGTAKERAVLYALLSDHMDLRGARATAAQRIFEGAVTSRQRFLEWYISAVDAQRFDPNIRREFLEEFDRSCTHSADPFRPSLTAPTPAAGK